MGIEDFLHLPGPDLVAAAVDHVLDPVHDEEVSLLVHADHIARMEPAPGHGRLGGLGLPPVFLHDLGPPEHQFPLLAHGQIGAGLEIDHLRIRIRQRNPDGARLGLFDRVGVSQRARFRQTVALDEDLPADQPVELFFDRHGQRGGIGPAGLEGRHVTGPCLLAPQECDKHRRHAEKAGCPVLFDDFGDRFRQKAPQHNQCRPAVERHVHDAAHAAAVGHGNGTDKNLPPRVQRVPLGKLHGVRDDVPMGEHGPLWIACGSTRVEEDGHIPPGIDDHFRRTFPARVNQVVKTDRIGRELCDSLARGGEDDPDAQSFGCGQGHVGHAFGSDEDLGTGIPELMRKFLFRGKGVAGGDGRSGHPDAVVTRDDRGGIRDQRPHAVSLADPQVVQARRQRVGPVPELPVGQPVQFGPIFMVEKQDGVPVRKALEVALEDPPGGNIRIRKMPRQMAGP